MNPSMMHKLVINDIFTLWNLHLVCFEGSLNVENVLVFRDDGSLEGELLQFWLLFSKFDGKCSQLGLKTMCILFLINFYRKALQYNIYIYMYICAVHF